MYQNPMKDYLVIKTKITPSKLGKNILKRPRLLNLLRANLNKKLVLVSADAGYGKTTLLLNLASEIEQHRRAWYTIDKGDADFMAFMEYLLESIVQAYPNFGKKTKIVIKNAKDLSASIEMVVGTFINEITDTLVDELFVFLDDYQEVSESTTINNALDYLLEHQPSNLHLIISTRSLPPFQLAKLNAKQKLFILQKEDIQFTREESGVLFKDIYHIEITDEEISKIEEHTKGWITALQLILQELAYKKPDEVIDVYSKAGEKVFEYFGNEIMQKLPESLQSFLLKSSILESMEPELLNNLLEINNSAEMLDSVTQLNLFISTIPGERKVYKYHPLFRDFLIHHLNETFDKESIKELHQKAATYFVQTGTPANAIQHWITSADYEKAAELIEKVAKDMFVKGRWDTVNNWINNLPSDLIYNHPKLLVIKGNILFMWGKWDEAMQMFKKAKEIFDKSDDKPGSCRALQFIGMITITRGDAAKGLEIEREALQMVPKNAYSLKVRILNDISRAQQRLGKYKEAINTFNEALSLSEKIEDLYLQSMILHNMGVIYHSQGDFSRAEESYKNVLEICSKIAFPRGWATYNNMALISLERGDYSQCKIWLEKGTQICKDFSDQRGLAHSCNTMGNMFRETGEYKLAMEKYQQALTLNLKLKEEQLQVECLDSIARLYMVQGDFYRADQYISKALKIAQKRGKNLQFAQIILTRGEIEVATGALEEAEKTLLDSLSIIEKLDVNYELMQVYFWLAYLYLKKKGAPPIEKQKLNHYIKGALSLASKYGYDYFLIKNCRYNPSFLVTAVSEKIEPRYAIFILSQIVPTARLSSPKTSRDAFNALTSLFELKDESIQRWVIEGLVNIGDERALNWLEKLNKEDYTSLKENISEAITRLQKVKRAPREIGYEFEKEVKHKFENIVGNHPKMRDLYLILDKIIDTDATVLIEGETGTGKELVARAIHYNGKRKDKKFVALACGALPETLLESELFGYVKGAFTGALTTKKGLFEEANGGTLFLDDVTNLTPGIQAKLLRVLEDKEVRRVGGTSSMKVDVHIIASTNKDLGSEVKEGRFREDLYYRLAVIRTKLPPLRERKSDIPLLTHHFLKKYSKKINKNIKGFQKEAMDLLFSYDWPGNVRELEHEIERMVTLLGDSKIIPLETLSREIKETQTMGKKPKEESLAKIEKSTLVKILNKYNWNKTKAAEALGITRQGLNKKIKRYNLSQKI